MKRHKDRQFRASIKKILCPFHWVKMLPFATIYAWGCPVCSEVIGHDDRERWLRKWKS